jgi:two-component system, LytTR family, response regulator
MSLTSVIVEDLHVAAEYLKKCCEKSGQIEVLAHCMTVKGAIEFLSKKEVDLMFLDVEMPEGRGFDVLDNISYSSVVITRVDMTTRDIFFMLKEIVLRPQELIGVKINTFS